MKQITKNTIHTSIGLILIIFGFIISPGITIIIGFPLYLIGAIVLCYSNRSIKFKILSVVLPLLLFPLYTFLLSHLYMLSLGPEKKFDFIIQENFAGQIIIINNLDCPTNHEIGRRTKIYVPDHGITHCKGTFPSISQTYTRVIQQNKEGKSKELNWYDLSKGEKGISMTGRQGIIVDDKRYTTHTIGISGGFSRRMRSGSIKKEAIQYVRNCLK